MDLLAAIAINIGAALQFRRTGGVASAQRGLSNMQQRAAGGHGGHPPGGHPQQPQQPGPGGYPPQGGPQ
ncbi:MAG: hypothetical protein JO082_04165 [Mycobacterium sp.]|nr:hypothetical protein [Mycobacterium sp.]